MILQAVMFAEQAHRGQMRKYTGIPYITHCLEVAQTVSSVGGTQEQVVAAILHDTVEDTDVTLSELEKLFGMEVAIYVEWLTDCGKEIGNRATRKKIDCARLSQAPDEVQTIKLADLLSNTATIAAYDPAFAKVYLAEKRDLLAVMRGGHSSLRRIAVEQCK